MLVDIREFLAIQITNDLDLEVDDLGVLIEVRLPVCSVAAVVAVHALHLGLDLADTGEQQPGGPRGLRVHFQALGPSTQL